MGAVKGGKKKEKLRAVGGWVGGGGFEKEKRSRHICTMIEHEVGVGWCSGSAGE